METFLRARICLSVPLMAGVLASLFSLSLTAAAAEKAYDLKMELSKNGHLISKPHLLVKEGEPGNLTHENRTAKNFVEVVAMENSTQDSQGILMNFVVGYIDQNGQRVIVSKPQIFAKENEPAHLRVGDDQGKENFTLSVVARRKSL